MAKLKKYALFVMLLFYIASGTTYTMSFLPTEYLLYSYDYSGYPLKKAKSPLMVTSVVHKDGNGMFNYIFRHITNDPPPDDIAVFTSTVMDSHGNSGFWKEKHGDTTILSSVRLGREPVLFPYLNKKSYEIGEEWQMPLPIQISYYSYTDSVILRTKKKKTVIVTQKFKSVKRMLGYECAEIIYRFSDTLTDDFYFTTVYDNDGNESLGKKHLTTKCTGTVYLAMKEGFIVSDIMRLEQDMVSYDNKITRKLYPKNLRLLRPERAVEDENTEAR